MIEQQNKMRIIATLLTIVALSITPAAQGSDWSYGIQAGLTAHATTGSLSDNFKGCVGFTAGFTADYQRLRLKADVTYGQPSFKNPNMYGVLDSQGRDAQINAKSNASHVGLSLQLGYTVARVGRLSITPCAGLYYSRYSWGVNDIEWVKNEDNQDVFHIIDRHDTSLGRASWMASLDVDVRLHDSYTDLTGSQKRLRSSLRVTPWVTRLRHKAVVPQVSGMQVGVNLSYSGLLSSLGE